MEHGVVKWFNSKKGWGFIVCKGVEYFVHYQSIMMLGYKTLDKGDEVAFIPRDSGRGPMAESVTLILAADKEHVRSSKEGQVVPVIRYSWTSGLPPCS